MNTKASLSMVETAKMGYGVCRVNV